MQSKTKFNISDGQVRAVFAAAGLGEATEITAVSDGWYNNVLTVTAGGEKYVLKVAPHPEVPVLTYEEGIMEKELRFYALLRERTKVVTPKIVFQDFSREVIPCDWFIMEFLPGTRLDKTKLSRDEKAGVDKVIQDILAEFHGIAGEGFGYEQNGLEETWYLALRKMAQNMAGDCARFGKSCRMGEKLLRYIDRHRAVLEAVPSVLVNFDLHSGNIMYDDGKLAVFDLERCFWGDRIGDFIVRGMSPPKAFGREEQIRFYLLMAYLAVMMHTEKYSRYHPLNVIWWMDVGGALGLGLKSFAALRKLSKA